MQTPPVTGFTLTGARRGRLIGDTGLLCTGAGCRLFGAQGLLCNLKARCQRFSEKNLGQNRNYPLFLLSEHRKLLCRLRLGFRDLHLESGNQPKFVPPHRRDLQAMPASKRSSGRVRGAYKCSLCHQAGHTKPSCPLNPKTQHNNQATTLVVWTV